MENSIEIFVNKLSPSGKERVISVVEKIISHYSVEFLEC